MRDGQKKRLEQCESRRLTLCCFLRLLLLMLMVPMDLQASEVLQVLLRESLPPEAAAERLRRLFGLLPSANIADILFEALDAQVCHVPSSRFSPEDGG